MVITPVHMDHQSHGTRIISWVIMAHTLGMFGLSGVSGWATARFGRVVMIVAGSLILVSASILAPLADGLPLLALALFLLGLGWNICFVAGSALLSDAVSADERGRVQGASEALVAVASGLGSLGAGVLFQWSGAFLGSDMVLPSIVGLLFCFVLLGATFMSASSSRSIPVPGEL